MVGKGSNTSTRTGVIRRNNGRADADVGAMRGVLAMYDDILRLELSVWEKRLDAILEQLQDAMDKAWDTIEDLEVDDDVD